jgi:hypothetical protein
MDTSYRSRKWNVEPLELPTHVGIEFFTSLVFPMIGLNHFRRRSQRLQFVTQQRLHVHLYMLVVIEFVFDLKHALRFPHHFVRSLRSARQARMIRIGMALVRQRRKVRMGQVLRHGRRGCGGSIMARGANDSALHALYLNGYGAVALTLLLLLFVVVERDSVPNTTSSISFTLILTLSFD